MGFFLIKIHIYSNVLHVISTDFLIDWLIDSLVHSFIHLFIHLFIHWFTHSSTVSVTLTHLLDSPNMSDWETHHRNLTCVFAGMFSDIFQTLYMYTSNFTSNCGDYVEFWTMWLLLRWRIVTTKIALGQGLLNCLFYKNKTIKISKIHLLEC